MRATGTSSAVAAVASLLLPARTAPAQELPELAAKTRRSVVHLKVFDAAGEQAGTGTGFFVDGSRLATNHHVIAEAARVTAKLDDGRELEVPGILAADPDRDIAVVQVVGEALPGALTLGASNGLRQGDEVVVIGSPHGLEGTLSVGVVSAVRGEGLERGPDRDRRMRSWAIQITAAISAGSSGSPIMTRDGTVVAVAVGIVGGGGSLGFGVPIEVVKELLSGLRADARPQPFAAGGRAVARNLVISAAVFGAIALAFVLPGVVRRLRRRPRPS